MVVGANERTFAQGESVIVCADVPVSGRVVKASQNEPYLAVAVELDVALMRDIAVELDAPPAISSAQAQTLFVEKTDEAALDCALRLMRLLDRPEAVPILQPGIMRELHYWLLCGQHGLALRALALPGSSVNRLAPSIALLRAEFRSRISVSRLAEAAAMSLTSFHLHFKQLTSLTPIQFQKRLRLIEARRLLLHDGCSASRAAFEVGYESVSQFTREYARMFGAPPKRDSLRRSREHVASERSGAPRAASLS